MVEDIKSKYPKTWEVLLEIVKRGEVRVTIPTYLFCFIFKPKTVYEPIKPNTEEFTTLIKDYVESINEPIWSLCESLLTGQYGSFEENNSKHIISLVGVDFVVKGNNPWDVHLTHPSITDNDYEAELLDRVLYYVIRWESKDKIRKELKDKLCGGIDDK